MNLCSSSISIWTMTVSVIGLFSIIALNRASLSTIEWPQKWPRQEAEEIAQISETFSEVAFQTHSTYVQSKIPIIWYYHDTVDEKELPLKNKNATSEMI